MSARLGEAVLSRKLGQHAVVLRERAGHAGWSPERVELAVCALFGARLLALTAGRERFGRDDVRAVAPALGDALAAPLVQWLDTGDPALRASFDAALALLCAARAPSLPASAALLAFYEPFLAAYDPELRRERGVYFTPPELAVYVVRRVDRWLVEEGGVADGLAASLVMLDPACGSGVFLSAAVSCIHARCVAHWQRRRLTPPELAAAWQRYVPEQLLPRLCGFDVLPSACALAQLQVRVALAETGYRSDGRETVAIERADALALLASRDERLARAEVILGNPPYARGGTGRGAFWDELLAPYKTSMRGERNLQPLADDYVRFARLAEHLLARKSLAVAALVTNSTFLHGHLHRDMRASLASTFPRIEVLDLGGSTRRHARGTRTGRDENVFGVAQGIAVTLFGRAPRLSPAPVRHAALHGARAWKLEQLATPETIAWQPLGEQPASSLPFVPRSIVASEYAA
ncbi:MAG TPA: N-6 DNA methylase, partial [Polyangiales bacterium]|nr:N-6 DNA methylase [Polyangiales bacterium]